MCVCVQKLCSVLLFVNVTSCHTCVKIHLKWQEDTFFSFSVWLHIERMTFLWQGLRVHACICVCVCVRARSVTLCHSELPSHPGRPAGSEVNPPQCLCAYMGPVYFSLTDTHTHTHTPCFSSLFPPQKWRNICPAPERNSNVPLLPFFPFRDWSSTALSSLSLKWKYYNLIFFFFSLILQTDKVGPKLYFSGGQIKLFCWLSVTSKFRSMVVCRWNIQKVRYQLVLLYGRFYASLLQID